MNKYGHLSVFVQCENLRMNWERLDRSAGLTHFTDEETDWRRGDSCPKSQVALP